MFITTVIVIISSLPKGRSLASKFSNLLGFQPSSSYPHMYHLIHYRSCPLLAFPLVSFLPFSLLAPNHQTILPYNMSNPVLLSVPYRFYLASLFIHGAEYLFICPFVHPANLSHSSPHPHFKGV